MKITYVKEQAYCFKNKNVVIIYSVPQKVWEFTLPIHKIHGKLPIIRKECNTN